MIGAWAIAALAIAADDDPLLVVEEPPAARSPWSWSARTLALVAADTTADGDEDTLATALELGLGLGLEASPAWDARAHARVRHLMGARPGATRHDLDVDVVEAHVTWRPIDGAEVSAGWLADLRWPALASPHPVDLALGPLPPTGEPRDRHSAIPALHLAHALGPARVELLWQPVEVAPRVPLAGSDWAPVEVAGFDALADVARADGLAGGSAGARVTLRGSRWDLGLTWLWRVDPVPVAPGVTARQHRVAADARVVTGPVSWRVELAGVDRHAAWTTAREPARAPVVEAILAASAAPSILVDLELGLRALHAFEGGPRWLVAGPDDVEAHARVGLLLAWDGVLRLDLEGRLALLRPDGDLALALGLRASARDEVALGITIFEGSAVAGGRGALYDADDALWARWVRAW